MSDDYQRMAQRLAGPMASYMASALLGDSGTFTPTFGGSTTNGTFGYAQQIGRSVRVGPLLYVNIILQASSMAVAPTGNLRINGLPVAPVVNTALAIGYQTEATIATGIANIGLTYIEFYSTAGGIINASVASASLYLIVSGVYEV